jgi:CRISPR/Cas system CSM-associated protein Csm3 (group 7 of RAMP superfamily)
MFGNEFQAGALRFAHLGVAISPDVSDFTAHIRTSVTINRQRRIAEDRLLRTIEAANDGLIYRHDAAIEGTIREESYASLLYAAMQLNTIWGHSKSRGLGWMKLLTMNVWIDDNLRDHNNLINALATLSTVASTGQHQDG